MAASNRSCSRSAIPCRSNGHGRPSRRVGARPQSTPSTRPPCETQVQQARLEVDQLQCARIALSRARQLHKEGLDEQAVAVLSELLNASVSDCSLGGRRNSDDRVPQEWTQMAPCIDSSCAGVLLAMAALGCFICNSLAAKLMKTRAVARAFRFTVLCERWLLLQDYLQTECADSEDGEQMWLRLRFDNTLNTAELAQASDDLPKALTALRDCERIQEEVFVPPDPEAVHLCLAEVLLVQGIPTEAALSAARAIEILSSERHESERKAFSLFFALSLEQAALVAINTPQSLQTAVLQCFPSALRLVENAEGSIMRSNGMRDLWARMQGIHWTLTVKPNSNGSPERFASYGVGPVNGAAGRVGAEYAWDTPGGPQSSAMKLRRLWSAPPRIGT